MIFSWEKKGKRGGSCKLSFGEGAEKQGLGPPPKKKGLAPQGLRPHK